MALTSPPPVNIRNFMTLFKSWLDDLVSELNAKSEVTHDHDGGSTVASICANESTLGTGTTDGEIKICADSGNLYFWDDTNSKWQIADGNIYATGDLPTTSYTIPTYTRVIDSTTGTRKEWNGSSWATVVATITDHTELSNIGSNTHAQIDTHLGSTSNPHSVDADDVNCLDKTNTTSFTPSADYHPATKKYVDDAIDTEKDQDHTSGSTHEIARIIFGTSATPPTANTVPQGTIYVQYTA